MDVVEVIQPFTVGGLPITPGDRLLAVKIGGRWRICFNGLEQDAPEGAVGTVGSPEVLEAAARRSAREEEYQLAPPPSAPPKSGS